MKVPFPAFKPLAQMVTHFWQVGKVLLVEVLHLDIENDVYPFLSFQNLGDEVQVDECA